jgi:hypothetical protein
VRPAEAASRRRAAQKQQRRGRFPPPAAAAGPSSFRIAQGGGLQQNVGGRLRSRGAGAGLSGRRGPGSAQSGDATDAGWMIAAGGRTPIDRVPADQQFEFSSRQQQQQQQQPQQQRRQQQQQSSTGAPFPGRGRHATATAADASAAAAAHLGRAPRPANFVSSQQPQRHRQRGIWHCRLVPAAARAAGAVRRCVLTVKGDGTISTYQRAVLCQRPLPFVFSISVYLCTRVERRGAARRYVQCKGAPVAVRAQATPIWLPCRFDPCGLDAFLTAGPGFEGGIVFFGGFGPMQPSQGASSQTWHTPALLDV